MTSETSTLAATSQVGSAARDGVARRLVDRFVPAPSSGQLTLVLPNGERVERRADRPGPEAELVLRRWRGIARMMVDGEHGFAEGYIRGDWDTPELLPLLDFFMHNEKDFAARSEPSWVTGLRNRFDHRRHDNTRRRSRRNIAAHYDLGNAFYAQWLDTGMNYSSALYAGGMSLEDAQAAKLERIAGLLDLQGGESVLEIGCGWGPVLEHLLRRGDCTTVGITLSREQLAFARRRLAAEIDAGRAELRLQDYREVADRFDRIVSVEMLEAVGERWWATYFERLRACLNPGGVAVLQAITIDPARFETYRRRPDYIQRHIFPGGMLPTTERLETEARRAGLTLAERQDFGASYAETLAEWRRRFRRSWERIEPLGFDARFHRMWEYYLTYCEVGFRARGIDVSFFKLRG